MNRQAEELYADARSIVHDMAALQCSDPSDELAVQEYANTLKFKITAAELLVIAARDICADDYRMKALAKDQTQTYIIPRGASILGDEQ